MVVGLNLKRIETWLFYPWDNQTKTKFYIRVVPDNVNQNEPNRNKKMLDKSKHYASHHSYVPNNPH